MAHLLPALAERGLRDLHCVATSPATAARARELGLPVEEFERLDRLDVAIDGADQVDPDGWLVKGGEERTRARRSWRRRPIASW